ncbi:MAG: Asp-tRNA(Asn)/Glu-tRNA(Gln) amidotransferase subunit GatC [Syntrophaceae bacterium]
MKISAAEVSRVARLARLNLNESEVAGFRKDLDAILTYMDLLNEVDTQGISVTVHTQAVTAPLRADELKESQSIQDVLANTTHHKNGSIEVPKVLE